MVQRDAVYVLWGFCFNIMTYDGFSCGVILGITIWVKIKAYFYELLTI
jgi:hypothetical protein